MNLPQVYTWFFIKSPRWFWYTERTPWSRRRSAFNKLTSRKDCVFLWCGLSVFTLYYVWSISNRKTQFPSLLHFLSRGVVWFESLRGRSRPASHEFAPREGCAGFCGHVKLFTPSLAPRSLWPQPAFSAGGGGLLSEEVGWAAGEGRGSRQRPNRTWVQCRGCCHQGVQDKVTWSLKMTARPPCVCVCVCVCKCVCASVYAHVCFCLVSW